jgi:hypothetical protein
VSRTVGHGDWYAINLDQPLSTEDLQYLASRDPKFRSVLEDLGHREPLVQDGSISGGLDRLPVLSVQLVPEAPRTPNTTTR